MTRRAMLLGVLAVLGLVAAAAVGLLVNSISDDSIGLAAAPLSAGRDLAPPEAREERAEAREERRDRAANRRQERRERARERREEVADQAASAAITTVPQTTTPTVEAGDDNGGELELEDDNSGSGSSSSGSGSGGSDD